MLCVYDVYLCMCCFHAVSQYHSYLFFCAAAQDLPLTQMTTSNATRPNTDVPVSRPRRRLRSLSDPSSKESFCQTPVVKNPSVRPK